MTRFNNFIANIVLLISLSIFVKADFPTDPKPCAYGDSDCLVKVINYYATKKYTGDGNINLVPIDPLKVSEIRIKQGADSPVNIDLKFTDNDVIGLSSVNVYDVKGFGKDLTGNHEIHTKFQRVSLLGDYTINGRILVLPIKGNGKANMTLVNTDAIFAFSGVPVEKNGEKYMKVTNMRITFKPERLWYNFENLFNGDKELSDNMNIFLNDNWRDIFEEVKGSLSKAFGKVFNSIVTTVFDKYPYEKFFTE